MRLKDEESRLSDNHKFVGRSNVYCGCAFCIYTAREGNLVRISDFFRRMPAWSWMRTPSWI